MSHLLKKDKKIYFKCFKITLISFILIFTYFGFSNYIGNKILYLSFSIICNFLIFFDFRRNAIFFETYFSIFLWLGFGINLLLLWSFQMEYSEETVQDF